ncbi:hypothetical protein MHYP_G00060800 [Metynnis hypsauchen]
MDKSGFGRCQETNPPDCSKAQKLVCNINKGCGYGCQLHHVVYCFMIAYGTQRTLILESHNWRYANNGWETVFRPVSDTCTDRTGASTGHWSVLSSNANLSAAVCRLNCSSEETETRLNC